MPSPDGYLGEAATIRSWFTAAWPSGTPLQANENAPFPEKPDNAPYGRLLIRSRDGGPVSVGGPTRRHRYAGDVIVELFAPANTGDGALRELADQALEILRDREEGGIKVWRARAVPVGPDDGWYRLHVLASYTRDQTHTIT